MSELVGGTGTIRNNEGAHEPQSSNFLSKIISIFQPLHKKLKK